MCPGSLLRLVKVGVGRLGCSIISSLLGFEVSNDLLYEEADVEYSRYYLDLRLSVAFPASAFLSKTARATLLDDPGRVSAGFLTTDVRGALALATGRALVAVVVRTLGLMVVVVVVAVEDAVRSRDAAAAGWERVDVAESDGTRRGVEAERDAPTRAAAERVVDNAPGPLASGLASFVFDAGGSAAHAAGAVVRLIDIQY